MTKNILTTAASCAALLLLWVALDMARSTPSVTRIGEFESWNTKVSAFEVKANGKSCLVTLVKVHERDAEMLLSCPSGK
jgi:hypothetical protein